MSVEKRGFRGIPFQQSLEGRIRRTTIVAKRMEPLTKDAVREIVSYDTDDTSQSNPSGEAIEVQASATRESGPEIPGQISEEVVLGTLHQLRLRAGANRFVLPIADSTENRPAA
jgi:hypothetical protein